jgi:hypothetical protein
MTSRRIALKIGKTFIGNSFVVAGLSRSGAKFGLNRSG